MKPPKQYKFNGHTFPASPEEIADALLNLQFRHGKLKPEYVLDEARRNRRSCLHKCIEWNKDKAAKNWQLQQAKDLINKLLVLKDDGKGNVFYTRMFVNIMRDENGQLTMNNYRQKESLFVTVDEVLMQPGLREYVFQKFFRELHNIEKKYYAFIQLKTIFEEAEKVKKKLEDDGEKV